MMKKIVLCADDYGQAPHVSQAILNLLKTKRISAVSALVTNANWQTDAQQLIPFKQQADVGLHLNLTEGRPLSKAFRRLNDEFPALSRLMGAAFCRLLDPKVIYQECLAQLDAYADAMNTLPHFIDGHQHVHQLPVIREVLARIYAERFDRQPCYFRLVTLHQPRASIASFLKQIIIHLAGSRSMKALLIREKIQYNESFAGVYAFNQAANYPDFFKGFLAGISSGGVIMCHPGLKASLSVKDPIAEARYLEYQYLSGQSFLLDCQAMRVALTRYC